MQSSVQCGGLDDPFPIQVFRRRLAIRQYWSGGPDPTLWICPPFDQRLCNVLLGVNIGTFPMTDLIAPVPDVPTAALQSCVLQVAVMHSWPRCPLGDIRPEAILSRAFGSSGTARHRQVTLYKGPDSSDLDFWFNSTPFLYFCIINKKNILWHQV